MRQSKFGLPPYRQSQSLIPILLFQKRKSNMATGRSFQTMSIRAFLNSDDKLKRSHEGVILTQEILVGLDAG